MSNVVIYLLPLAKKTVLVELLKDIRSNEKESGFFKVVG